MQKSDLQEKNIFFPEDTFTQIQGFVVQIDALSWRQKGLPALKYATEVL